MTPTGRHTLADPEVQKSPFTFYTWLRDEAPIYFDPELKMYIVSRYEDIRTILRDPALFSSRVGAEMTGGTRGEVREVFEKEGWGERREVLLTNDPPDHTKYRKLVDRAFTASRVQKMEPYIESVVETLVDGVVERGGGDLIADFAVPVPLTVIADELGIAKEDIPRFKQWSDAAVAPLSRNITLEDEIAAARLVNEMHHYFAEVIEDRKQTPRDDLISDLVHAEADSEVSIKDLLSILQSLLVAGNETTTNAIGAALLILVQSPEFMQELHANNGKIKTFVEEVLRLEAPVQGLLRITTEDTEIAGTNLPAGSALALRYGSGNRDEREFADPDRLDLNRRRAASHLSFGSGIHHCIGAFLSRRELYYAVRGVVTRFSKIELAADGRTPTIIPSFTLRGLANLDVEVTRR